MKCKYCGAEIGTYKKYCNHCGSQISYNMRREQEQMNMDGCPKCKSSNIQFDREYQGEIKLLYLKQIIHQTVGICKDCGYTWYPFGNQDITTEYQEIPSKIKNMFWGPKKESDQFQDIFYNPSKESTENKAVFHEPNESQPNMHKVSEIHVSEPKEIHPNSPNYSAIHFSEPRELHIKEPNISMIDREMSPAYQDSSPNFKIIWWLIGWIVFFPIPVMILIWRRKNKWSLKVKIIVTVVFWMIILGIV